MRLQTMRHSRVKEVVLVTTVAQWVHNHTLHHNNIWNSVLLHSNTWNNMHNHNEPQWAVVVLHAALAAAVCLMAVVAVCHTEEVVVCLTAVAAVPLMAVAIIRNNS
jgi:hypothetical protein